jgi:hypothetical protein
VPGPAQLREEIFYPSGRRGRLGASRGIRRLSFLKAAWLRTIHRVDWIYPSITTPMPLLGKVFRILHHLNAIKRGRGTHSFAGQRRIGIDRQHAGHGDCSRNGSCREVDRDLAHLAHLISDGCCHWDCNSGLFRCTSSSCRIAAVFYGWIREHAVRSREKWAQREVGDAFIRGARRRYVPTRCGNRCVILCAGTISLWDQPDLHRRSMPVRARNRDRGTRSRQVPSLSA